MKPSFEDCIKIIDAEIAKRKGKWTLTAIAWMDYKDVAQILRLHIYKKWEMFDSAKGKLEPWLNTIITNQIRNLIRNHYSNFQRPCLHCAAAQGGNLCAIYQTQCNTCPLFADWEKRKKPAYNTKMPVSIENHIQEISDLHHTSIDIDRTAVNLHEKMKKILKPNEWTIYRMVFVEHENDEKVAKALGFKSNEEGRRAGYKQIQNIRKNIIKKVKKALYNDEIDIVV